MRFVRPFATAAAVSAALALAACSGTSSTAGHPRTALQAALGRIADTSSTRSQVLFSRRSFATNVKDPYYDASALGAGQLAAYAAITPRYLGFDATTAATAVEAGTPPNTSYLLTGISTDGVAAKLGTLGATKSGNVYRLLPDHALGTPARTPLGPLGLLGLNVVQLDGTTIRYATTTAGLHALDASGASLGDDAAFTSAAACLGDPLSAELVDRVPPSEHERQAPTVGVRLVALGVSGRRGITPSETMCVVATSPSTAAVIEKAVRAAVTSGQSQAAHLPWSQLLHRAVVHRSGNVVALSAKSTKSIVLIEALEHGDLPGISG